MPLLISTSDDASGEKIQLPADREIVFGRAEDADVTLKDRNASRHHARFVWSEGQPVLIDLGSANGTLVNGLPITQMTLMDGDTVAMGVEEFRFVEDAPKEDSRKKSKLKLKKGTGKTQSIAPADVTTQSLNMGSQEEQMEALYDAYMKLKTLYRALQQMWSAESVSELYRIASDSILLSTGCDRVAFIEHSSEGTLRPVHQAWSRDLDEDEIAKKAGESREVISVDAINEAGEKKAPIFIFHTDDENAAGTLANSSSTLAAPILQGQSLSGIVYCDSPVTGKELSKNDLDMVATVAMQMAEPLSRQSQLDRMKQQQQMLSNEMGRGEQTIITRSPVMKPVMQMVRQVAPTDSTCLVQGESGTGKELLARAIHNLSKRNDGPFIPINCAALPENLIESELFGHEKGAFTGAFTRRPGKFEAADGGTLFLDEIGELPMIAQSKLLRVLQENEIQRIGSTQTIKVNVRVIAATNVTLEKAVKEKKFREDLFYRINVVAIKVPPLRDRFQDIPLLAQYYFDYFRKKIACPARSLSPEAMQSMAQYDWPGNIRELRNVMERALVLCNDSTILPNDLPAEISQKIPTERRMPSVPVETLEETDESRISTLSDMEKRHVKTVLDITKNNKQHAAKLLGISRTTLYEKIKAYQLGDS
jgi:transcriptional regulator with GAF, ATPase, and Fis domain